MWRARSAAHRGATAPVPPTVTGGLSRITLQPVLGSALPATSGTPRPLLAGCPPFCFELSGMSRLSHGAADMRHPMNAATAVLDRVSEPVCPAFTGQYARAVRHSLCHRLWRRQARSPGVTLLDFGRVVRKRHLAFAQAPSLGATGVEDHIITVELQTVIWERNYTAQSEVGALSSHAAGKFGRHQPFQWHHRPRLKLHIAHESTRFSSAARPPRARGRT